MIVKSSTGGHTQIVPKYRFNERRILETLRKQNGVSKAEIARLNGITNAAVGGLIKSLEKEGLIKVDGKKNFGRGQPATLLSLNYNSAFGIGIRVDRGAMETLLVNLGGEIVHRQQRYGPLPPPNKALPIIIQDVREAIDLIPGGAEKLAGIGLGMAFRLDAWIRELDLDEGSFDQWADFDLAEALAVEFKHDIILENDVTSAATAELFHGLGRQYKSFAYIYLGIGVGGGLVLEGEVWQGERQGAAELGLIPVPLSKLDSALKPTTESWTQLQTRASTQALLQHLHQQGAAIDNADSYPLLKEKFPIAVEEWLDDCTDALMVAIYSLQAVVDVPVVVIDSDDQFSVLDDVTQKLSKKVKLYQSVQSTEPAIVKGTLGSDACALGAATLPLNIHFAENSRLFRFNG